MNNRKNTDQLTGRLRWIDIAKGIAIICTIIGHTASYGGRTRNLIYSFHMPLFFMLAGYTIKQVSTDQLLKATKKDFFRLIVPVFIIRGINFIAALIKHEPFAKSLWENIRPILWGNGNNYGPLPLPVPLQMYGVGALWFLIALFWAKLLYRIFDIYIKNYRFIILLIFSFFGMWVGSILPLPHCLDMMPLIMFFMECGRYIRTNIDMNSSLWEKAGIISFFLWIFLAGDKGIYIEMATRQYPYSMLCVLIAILGCIVIIQFSQGLEQIGHNKLIVMTGVNSLDLLCIHHIDTYYSFIWKIFMFPESRVCTSLMRVSVDVIILMLWIFFKKSVINIIRKNKIRKCVL